MHCRTHRLAVVVMAVASPPVLAGGIAGQPTLLDTVDVNGEALFENADSATIGTVYAEQFEYRPLTRPAELMEVVPGLIVTQHSGEGKANQYFLRGFNLDHGTDFASFVDGMPVNLPSHAHGQGYSDLNFMIPELVDSIDYRKGPYYARYGDFSAAGAADIHYKNQLDHGVMQLTGGEYGYGRLLAADSQAVGGGQLLYGFEALHYDGPFVEGDNFNKGSGVLRWSRHAGSTVYHLEAMAYAAHWDSSDQIPQRAVDRGLSTFGCVDCSDAGSTYRYSLSAAMSRPAGGGRLEASAYAIRYHLNLYSDFTYYLNAANIALLPQQSLAFQPDPQQPTDQFEQLDTRNIFGGQLHWSRPAHLMGVDLTSEIGLQTRFDRAGASGLYDTQNRARYFTVVDDSLRVWNGAAYGQSDLHWNRWLRSVVGLRYDTDRFDVAANTPGNSGSKVAGIFAPKFSLIIGPFAKTEWFVNLGRGFHSNDARGVTASQVPVSAENPRPATAEAVTPLVAARGVDVGLRTALVPRTQIALSLFVLDLDSELSYAGDNGTTEAGAATRRSGVELSLFWRPLPYLVVDADYAYTHARYRRAVDVDAPAPWEAQDGSVTGMHIAEAPAVVTALGISYVQPDGWDGAIRLRYFGPRPLNEDASIRSAATTLLNASIGYRLTPRLRLSAEATNLLDSRDHDIDYYYASRLQQESAAVNDVHFHPVEPINCRLVLSWNW